MGVFIFTVHESCIYHFAKGQIHPYNAEGTNYRTYPCCFFVIITIIAVVIIALLLLLYYYCYCFVVIIFAIIAVVFVSLLLTYVGLTGHTSKYETPNQ